MRKIISFGLTAVVLAAIGTWAMTGTGTASDAWSGARIDAISVMAAMASTDMPITRYAAF